MNGGAVVVGFPLASVVLTNTVLGNVVLNTKKNEVSLEPHELARKRSSGLKEGSRRTILERR
jgi:hypothetical protein